MENDLLNTIASAGTDGVDAVELYGNLRYSEAATSVTNTLSKLRASGQVTTRRVIRDGQRVTVYYLASNAPSGNVREVING